MSVSEATRWVRLVRTDAAGLAPYAARLRELEQAVRYPLADGADAFRIDHGPAYHPFFSGLGDAHFLVALTGERVVGGLCGVARRARQAGRPVPSMYLCDFKLAPEHRGAGVGLRMAWRALATMAVEPRVRRWHLAYFAAMRGARGDVTRSLQGLHAGRLLRPEARLLLFFVAAERLAALDVAQAPPPPDAEAALDLSPDAGAGARAPGLVSTAGRKDLRLESTGRPWPLWHLAAGPGAWRPTLGHHLRACGEALAQEPEPATCCFALDERLSEPVRWLAGQGLNPGAACGVYTLRTPWSPPRPAWVHLATSEI